MCNVLYINKPAGITSFDVCHRLRKVLNTRKIGHTGTLDPNATGVMIILFDKATKCNQFIVSATKEYEAKVLLGVETDTLDIDGTIINKKECHVPEKKIIEDTLNSFIGRSEQTVPMTSAVSINGKRLYQYQREGIEVKQPTRTIEVYSIDLLDIDSEGFSFRCKVSSGTYIRSLVQDVLKKMDLIGTVKELKRTAVDNINLDMCDDLEEAEKGNYKVHDVLDIMKDHFECIEYEHTEDIKNGKRIRLDTQSDRVLITSNNKVLAVYEKDGDSFRSVRGLW